jgi:hypothetical protein
MVAVAFALTACASAGGSIFPEAGEPIAAIAAAERLINDAQQAGADSLAAEPLAAARTHLAEARAATGNRAALKGRQAQAAATFARAEAERKLAERAQVQAQESLRALPPGGAR